MFNELVRGCVMRVCSYCATLAFLLGVLLVLYIWPVFNRGLQSGSYPSYNAGYAGSGGYGGGYGGYRRGNGYGSNGGYGGDGGYSGYGGDGGYGGDPTNGAWGQSTYAIYAPYRPRPRI